MNDVFQRGRHLPAMQAPAQLAADLADRARAERFNELQARGLGYLHLQATRPQTIAYLLNDSPAGQLAWIADKIQAWTDPAAHLPEDAIDRDQMLTNASIFWFTGSGASSAHATCDAVQAWRLMQAAPAAGGPDLTASSGCRVPERPPPAAG
jgi:epoxide hydrolase